MGNSVIKMNNNSRKTSSRPPPIQTGPSVQVPFGWGEGEPPTPEELYVAPKQIIVKK